MIEMMIKILFILGAFFGMEAVAWFTHKYIMHGPLWVLHKDHHKKQSTGFFEHNDFFFLIFALPGIACLYFGREDLDTPLFWVGLGITFYGMTYFLVHDIFIHQRFKVLKKSRNSYLKGVQRAHKIHHKHLGKEHGECFGMLLVPFKYFRNQRR